jgi:hypothetical protein
MLTWWPIMQKVRSFYRTAYKTTIFVFVPSWYFLVNIQSSKKALYAVRKRRERPLPGRGPRKTFLPETQAPRLSAGAWTSVRGNAGFPDPRVSRGRTPCAYHRVEALFRCPRTLVGTLPFEVPPLGRPGLDVPFRCNAFAGDAQRDGPPNDNIRS